MTHTPWTFEGPKPFDGKADRNHLAYAWCRIVEHDGSTVGYTPDMPTATLFAAAPETAAERDKLKAINADLLAALENWQSWYADHFEDFDNETNMQLLCLGNESAAVAAKAESESA